MVFSEKVDEIVGFLRQKDINTGYAKIRALMQEIADHANKLFTDKLRDHEVKTLNNVSRIFAEIASSMQVNDTVYIIDLLKYELKSEIIKLHLDEVNQNGYL